MTTTTTSGAADLPEALTVAVDCWFAKNTGLGGCSDKDVRELADIFRLHALAAGQATAQQAAEPVALLVRKNSWREGQWEAATPNSPSYGLAWANQRMYVYAAPQPTQPQAGAVPLTDEYPALVCDYCGALTPDPWHSSGMLHGKMSKHIHSCDACAARGAARAQDTREPLTPERVKEIVRGAGYDQCGIPDTERAAFINGLRHGEREHGIKGGQHVS